MSAFGALPLLVATFSTLDATGAKAIARFSMGLMRSAIKSRAISFETSVFDNRFLGMGRNDFGRFQNSIVPIPTSVVSPDPAAPGIATLGIDRLDPDSDGRITAPAPRMADLLRSAGTIKSTTSFSIAYPPVAFPPCAERSHLLASAANGTRHPFTS